MKVVAKKIPCFYLFLFKVLKEKSGGKKFISYGIAREVMKRRLHKIPHRLHYVFLKELEGYQMVKQSRGENHSSYIELLGKDVTDDINSYLFPI